MSHSFRRLHSIDTDSFLSDLMSCQLITVTNPPDSVDCLLTAYNSTLSSLLDKHAPVITKISNRKSKSNPWFSHPLRAFRTTLRHAESVFKRTHSALDWSKFKSLQNRYHHLILDSQKKQYFSKLVSSSSDNPRRLWQTVNKLKPQICFTFIFLICSHFNF